MLATAAADERPGARVPYVFCLRCRALHVKMLRMNPHQLLDYLYRTKATLRQCQRELRFGGDDVETLELTISRAEKWLEEGIEANLKAIVEMADYDTPITPEEIDEIIAQAVAEVEAENTSQD